MREWRTMLGWVGAFTVPFVILSMFIVADKNRVRWPEWLGQIDELGMVVAATSGLLFVPRKGWKAKGAVAILYLPIIFVLLFFFAFSFVGGVYGDFL
jgi:hypothetical protein